MGAGNISPIKRWAKDVNRHCVHKKRISKKLIKRKKKKKVCSITLVVMEIQITTMVRRQKA
jgi:hypothetical protein